MTTLTFNKTEQGYMAHFKASGVIKLHIEFDKPGSTFFGTKAFEAANNYLTQLTLQTNPVDGCFQIGDGIAEMYVEIKCTQQPTQSLIGGTLL